MSKPSVNQPQGVAVASCLIAQTAITGPVSAVVQALPPCLSIEVLERRYRSDGRRIAAPEVKELKAEARQLKETLAESLDQSARAISAAGRSCRMSRARSAKLLAVCRSRHRDCIRTASPGPHSQASARWLLPRQGRSGWFSQTPEQTSSRSNLYSGRLPVRDRQTG
jgi:hypothetical protein